MDIIASLEPIRVRPSNLIRPLQEAAWQGHCGIVSLLLDKYHPYQNLDFAEPPHYKVFALAARASHEEVVILLLDKYREAILQHSDYFNVIKTACSEKKVSIARLLLKQGYELNPLEDYEIRELAKKDGYEAILKHLPEPGSSRLHIAASDGADIEEIFGEYGTALAAAAGEGQLSCIKYLLDKGADINSGTGSPLGLLSPVERAIIKRHSAVAEFLLQEGAQISVSSLIWALQEFDMPFITQLIKWGAKNSPPGLPFGGDLLRAVAGLDQVEIPNIIMLLVEEVASLNSYSGLTAIHKAVESGCQRNVKVLLELKASVNVRDWQDFVPLQIAAGLDRPDILSLLLEAGAEVNPGKGKSKSPLLIAVTQGRALNVKLLLGWKADVNLCRFGEDSPLQRAAGLNRPDILSLLLEAGAEFKSGYGKGDPPLLIAVGQGNILNAKLLLEAGANVNAMNSQGTLLQQAATIGNREIVQLLLDWHADLDLVSREASLTARTLALREGHMKVSELLERGHHNRFHRLLDYPTSPPPSGEILNIRPQRR
ncbi:hypothetical protein MMC31_006380 [Peltigera leucophlebia]|nr:hypothetical protein [Peltigera leucophlebia]